MFFFSGTAPEATTNSTPPTSSNFGAVVGAVLGVATLLVLIAIVLVVSILLARRRRARKKQLKVSMTETNIYFKEPQPSILPPINLTDSMEYNAVYDSPQINKLSPSRAAKVNQLRSIKVKPNRAYSSHEDITNPHTIASTSYHIYDN